MDDARDELEFAELLDSIGASTDPLGPETELFLKDQEIAELRQCLVALRPIGDRLAEVEQLRLAERAEHERELARRGSLLQRERERLARVRVRLAAREQRAREYRLLAQERGAELRELRARLRRHERELRKLCAQVPRTGPATQSPKPRKRADRA